MEYYFITIHFSLEMDDLIVYGETFRNTQYLQWLALFDIKLLYGYDRIG